jgi:hypothetical protein
MENNYPLKECVNCTGLECCPFPDVLDDGRGTVIPPEYCPFPIDKIRKKRDSKMD